MKDQPRLAKGERADVTFLLEGTYPYVSGGVSSWVHEIILGLPELRFAVVFLGSTPEQHGPMRYTLPRNLVHFEAHYLMQPEALPPPHARSGSEAALEDAEALHVALRERRGPLSTEVLDPVLQGLGRPGQGITAADFFRGEGTWRRICASYEESCTDPSFVDYFWTVRSMHAPLLILARIAERLPATQVVHAVSTGYAGFLGALLARRRGCPFVLTEHGIYTKERRIDLAQATWIKDPEPVVGEEAETSHIRWLWIRFFEGLGRMAYAAADPIVSLYTGNRDRQIADGAAAERTRVIPNGIDVPRFAALERPGEASARPVVGLVGRVVPIKDVGTFVRAMRIVCSRLPDAEGWIVGPADEDPAYLRECRDLIASLGLQDRVKLLGFRPPEQVFPFLTVTAMTSISEALPLVVLESFAAGVPVVTADVGACRELVEGAPGEDRALGAAGSVTPIASPESTARGVLALLTDPAERARASRAGRERVQRYYGRDRMLGLYRELYGRALEAADGGHRISAS
jgi:glycosyltransferase involved in cell wall biosynthesis